MERQKTLTKIRIGHYLFAMLVFVLFSSCVLQNKYQRKSYQERVYDRPLKAIQIFLDSTDNKWFDGDNPNTMFTLYADSINQYDKTGIVPFFLEQTCFDYDYSLYWPNWFAPICLRVGILSHVNDKKSLEKLLKNKKYKKILSTKCNRTGSHVAPNNNISFYDLLQVRLAKLNQEP